MSSWQDSLSEQALDELDALARAALPFAQEQLDTRGEFFPYGLVLTVIGETRLVTPDMGNDERPASTAVISAAIDGMRAERNDLRAIAIVADVRIPNGDAIRVEVEHREGQATAILLPYKKKRFGRGIEYGDLSGGGAAALQVWNA